MTTYEQFASGLPADRAMTSWSSDELEETMLRLGVEQPIRQLGRGAFRCDVAVAETEEGVFFSDRFNVAFATHVQPPPESIGCLFCVSAGGQMRAFGANVVDDRLLLFPEGCGTEIVSEDMGGSVAFTLPTDCFLELTETLCPGATFARLKQVVAIAGDHVRLHALRSALDRGHPRRPEVRSRRSSRSGSSWSLSRSMARSFGSSRHFGTAVFSSSHAQRTAPWIGC